MKKREKRVSYILRAGMTVLTIILIILFFGIMSLVSDLQGTARVVNYAGLVRGETQIWYGWRIQNSREKWMNLQLTLRN